MTEVSDEFHHGHVFINGSFRGTPLCKFCSQPNEDAQQAGGGEGTRMSKCEIRAVATSRQRGERKPEIHGISLAQL